jgi:hypothetical protein
LTTLVLARIQLLDFIRIRMLHCISLSFLSNFLKIDPCYLYGFSCAFSSSN